MKQFYSSLLKLRFTKSILLSAFFLWAFYTPEAQVYYATLLGSSEFPANNSTGTGKAVVTIDGNSMRVQVTFSGLVAQTSAGLPQRHHSLAHPCSHCNTSVINKHCRRCYHNTNFHRFSFRSKRRNLRPQF